LELGDKWWIQILVELFLGLERRILIRNVSFVFLLNANHNSNNKELKKLGKLGHTNAKKHKKIEDPYPPNFFHNPKYLSKHNLPKPKGPPGVPSMVPANFLLIQLLNHFFCQTVSCWRSLLEVLPAHWTRLHSVFVAFRTHQVMLQTREDLNFSVWYFQTNDALQFFSSFFLNLQHGIHSKLSRGS